jgi:hypothetical protein
MLDETISRRLIAGETPAATFGSSALSNLLVCMRFGPWRRTESTVRTTSEPWRQ